MSRDQEALAKCYRCGNAKPVDQFAWRRKAKGQRDSFCRPCRAAYKQEHYARHRQRYVDQAGERSRQVRLKRTLYLLRYFESHPCVDCGESDPVVLEFDHLGDKLFNIGSSLTSHPWPRILDEMQKCDVVCANCHRRRTAKRRGSLRLALTKAGGGS